MKKDNKKFYSRLIKYLMLFVLTVGAGASLLEIGVVNAEAKSFSSRSSVRSSSFRSSSRPSSSSFKSSSKSGGSSFKSSSKSGGSKINKSKSTGSYSTKKSSSNNSPKVKAPSKNKNSGYTNKSPNKPVQKEAPKTEAKTETKEAPKTEAKTKSNNKQGYTDKSPNKPVQKETDKGLSAKPYVGKQKQEPTMPKMPTSKGKRVSYNTYMSNPYQSGFSTNNIFFYAWLFNSMDKTPEQKQYMKDKNIDEDAINNPEVDTYWVEIKDKDGENKVVSVTEAQYNQINKGDEVKVDKGIVTLNGEVLK